ncbi:MAG: U6 snRNA-associated Sm-like protein LSm6 [Thermofilum sp.]
MSASSLKLGSTVRGNPLDYIRRANGKNILVKLKDGTEYIGRLRFLDRSMNLLLDEAKEVSDTNKLLANLGTVFIRGSNLLYVSLDLSKVTFFEPTEAQKREEPQQGSEEDQED